jgi:hypothetical protein
MKRILGVLCLALALCGPLSASSRLVVPQSSVASRFFRTLAAILSSLRNHWRIAPSDGGHSGPPPDPPAAPTTIG